MIIALDAMGGDFAPEVTIDGAIESCLENNEIRVVLVGDEKRIAKELEKRSTPTDRILVYHAPDVVPMDESPSYALRKRKESSIAIAVDLVRDGKADAVVSAGHSGVAMAMSLIKLGKAKGVDRPAIATMMPSLKDPFVLLDAGANVDCEPKNLLEFAMMGSAYSSALFNKKNPKVALMNIGEEETKGNELTKESFKLLRKSHVNFIGNIEGKDMFRGRADVVVCDGFAGNITLKISEGLSEAIFRMLKREVSGGLLGRIGYLFMRPALKSFKRQTDYAEYGGAPLLGINGTCIISHGRSSGKAIKNAINVANTSSKKKVYEMISKTLQQDEQRELDVVQS